MARAYEDGAWLLMLGTTGLAATPPAKMVTSEETGQLFLW
jgi:hypothetical protein